MMKIPQVRMSKFFSELTQSFVNIAWRPTTWEICSNRAPHLSTWLPRNTQTLKWPGFWWAKITLLVCDLNRTPIVMAKHGGPGVHFSGISTCGRTSRETVSHPQRPPLPTLYKISLPVYVIVTNKRLQPLTTTYTLVLSFSLLKI